MARSYNYADAIGFLVRNVIRQAYGMPANSVRPANQVAPTGKASDEFATVLIVSDQGDLTTAVRRVSNDVARNSTKVLETLDVYHEFTASVQFFRHADPATDDVGLPAFGSGAFDKAAQLQSTLMLSPNMERLEKYGLMLLGASGARNLAGLVDGAIWEDRGSVDLYFGCSTSVSNLLETIASASVDLSAEWPGGRIDSQTIEVTP